MDVCRSTSSPSCSSASSVSEEHNEVLNEEGNTNYSVPSVKRLLKVSIQGIVFYININVFTYYSKKINSLLKGSYRALVPSRAIQTIFENETSENFYLLLQHISPFYKGVYPYDVNGSTVHRLLKMAVCYEFADLKLKCLHFLRESTPRTQKEDLYPLFGMILKLQRDGYPFIKNTTDTVHEYEVLMKISVRLLHDGQAKKILNSLESPPDYAMKALQSIYRLRHHNRQPLPKLFAFQIMPSVCARSGQPHDQSVGRQCVDCNLIDCENCTKRGYCIYAIRRALDVHTKRASPALICDSQERHPNRMPCSICVQLLK